MQTLQRVQELCDQTSSAISNEITAEKVNKSAHARIRANLNELKKLITAAKSESVLICKNATK